MIRVTILSLGVVARARVRITPSWWRWILGTEAQEYSVWGAPSVGRSYVWLRYSHRGSDVLVPCAVAEVLERERVEAEKRLDDVSRRLLESKRRLP